MANPRYENVSEMEQVAVGEESYDCNMRLVAKGFRNNWLRVSAHVNKLNPALVTYSWFHDVGRAQHSITREAAQILIDIEWGRR